MCGIIGILSNAPVSNEIIECLKRLEYRGYDSAGIATLVKGEITRKRAEGKIKNLEALLENEPLSGNIGIGHTRWATHGAPSVTNAHPHATDDVALVHNGIIENFKELKQGLTQKGYQFKSDTDSEVIAHLLTNFIHQGCSPQKAVSLTLKKLKGAFSLAILFKGHEDLLIGARKGSPLAVGVGEEKTIIGSDAVAISPLAKKIAYLEEGDTVVIEGGRIHFLNEKNIEVARDFKDCALSNAIVGKGNHRHFMHKEIHEQPTIIGELLYTLINPTTGAIMLPQNDIDWKDIEHLTIIACGTSYYAGCVAKYWIEKWAKIPVEVDIASEFRYRKPPIPPKSVGIFISQSGETADTLAAHHYYAELGHKTIGIVNAPESSLARLTTFKIETHAGPEIGVASTKAFTAQLTVLATLTLFLSRQKGTIDQETFLDLQVSLMEVPSQLREILKKENLFEEISRELSKSSNMLFIGRSTCYPIALEGALKLKEISYIHAEAYASGELKHGPIALIDEEMPIIALIPSDEVYEKNISNLQEILARRGQVYAFVDHSLGLDTLKWEYTLPKGNDFSTPYLYVLPMQLLAYHTAVRKGTDVDQPRNLAKSVTVE